MTGYDLFMSPVEATVLKKLRKTLLSKVKGNVLEIGVGTGVNFKYYNFNNIDIYNGIDVEITKTALNKANEKQTLLKAKAEKLPFEENTFDVAVVTLVLCAVDDAQKTLDELYRVLKPNGKLVFIEHILSEKQHIKSMFFSVDKYWYKFAHCSLCRKTDELIWNSQFTVKYLNKKAMGILCYGIAIK